MARGTKPERSNISTETLTTGMTYLYRWWLQQELGIIPEAYIRKEGESTLICANWVLAASSKSFALNEARRLREDLARSVYVFCPELPPGLAGNDLTTGEYRECPEDVVAVGHILRKYQPFLSELGAENPERDEWWKTRDAGAFKLWKSGSRRLLLYPRGGEVYGFTIAELEPAGGFFYLSRSRKEEGRVTQSGDYKMSDHAIPTGRKVSNLDLLHSDGKVSLFRLLPTGAGYKVFPRRVGRYEAQLG